MPELGSNDPYFGYDMGKHGLEDRKNSREKFVNFYPAIGDRMFEQRVCINFQSGRHYLLDVHNKRLADISLNEFIP